MENQILKMGKHQKHTNLVRRENDHFASNEISILGTNCGIISELIHSVSEQLSKYKLAYFDASHAKNVTKKSNDNAIKKLANYFETTFLVGKAGTFRILQWKIG